MRIVFMGTPDYAAIALDAIANSGHDIVLAVTMPDRRIGRSSKLVASPVKVKAIDKGIEVYQPERIKSEDSINKLKSIDADIYIVAAYGQILSKDILDIPLLGCVNIHASILPRLRGASPIQNAIIQGYTKTGITIMQMDVGMDTGDILLQEEIDIEDDDTTSTLTNKLAGLGTKMIIRLLKIYEDEKISSLAQIKKTKQKDSEATYCNLIKKEDGLIDWTQDAISIVRKVRAYNPWPGCYSNNEGSIIKVHEARVVDVESASGTCGVVIHADKKSLYIGTSQGVVSLIVVQRVGKKSMNIEEFLRGNKIEIGSKI